MSAAVTLAPAERYDAVCGFCGDGEPTCRVRGRSRRALTRGERAEPERGRVVPRAHTEQVPDEGTLTLRGDRGGRGRLAEGLAARRAGCLARDDQKCLESLLGRLHYLMRCALSTEPQVRRRDAMAIEAHALRWTLRSHGVVFHGQAVPA